jgi:hypothetical protein
MAKHSPFYCLILAHLGFFIHFFSDIPNSLPLWDLIKTHRGTSNNKIQHENDDNLKNLLSKTCTV